MYPLYATYNNGEVSRSNESLYAVDLSSPAAIKGERYHDITLWIQRYLIQFPIKHNNEPKQEGLKTQRAVTSILL